MSIKIIQDGSFFKVLDGNNELTVCDCVEDAQAFALQFVEYPYKVLELDGNILYIREPNVINVSEIIEPNGKTWRENNLSLLHNIPLGALVEINCDYLNTHMMRAYVVNHGRDCDGSPLYVLGRMRDSYVPYVREMHDFGNYGEESLTVIKVIRE